MIMAVPPVTVEFVTMLGMVDEVDFLEEIAADLGVLTLEAIRGDARRLYRALVNWVNSDGFDALEDGELSENIRNTVDIGRKYIV